MSKGLNEKAKFKDMESLNKKKEGERRKRVKEKMYKNERDKMKDNLVSYAVQILMKNPSLFHGDPVDSIQDIIESCVMLPVSEEVKEITRKLGKEHISTNEEYKKYIRYINFKCRYLEHQKYMSETELKHKDFLNGLDKKKNKKTKDTNK